MFHRLRQSCARSTANAAVVHVVSSGFRIPPTGPVTTCQRALLTVTTALRQQSPGQGEGQGQGMHFGGMETPVPPSESIIKDTTGGTAEAGSSSSSSSEAQKYYQCSACQKTFRLADAAQHHINTRHQGAAEVNVVDFMIREAPTTPGAGGSGTGGPGQSNSSDPSGLIANLASGAQNPSFPPPPKRKPLPSSELSSSTVEEIMEEASYICPRLNQLPLGSPLPDSDPTDLIMDSGRRQQQQLSAQTLVNIDAMTPDDGDGGVHASCVNDVALIGMLRSVSFGYDEKDVPCAQLRVEVKDDDGPELLYVRQLHYTPADKARLEALALDSVVFVKGSLRSMTLFDDSGGSSGGDSGVHIGPAEGFLGFQYKLPVVLITSAAPVVSLPSSGAGATVNDESS